MPVNRIGTADVMAVLLPIWAEKRETARRVRQRISAVMRWAVAQGYREDNPAGDAIGAALPKTGVRTRHQPALPYPEVRGAMERVRASRAYPSTVLAFEFLVLTACRSGEVRGARWEEMDLEMPEWRVPAGRMKTNRIHRVPFSTGALAVLREARRVVDDSDLVFPSVRGRPLLGGGMFRRPARGLRAGAGPCELGPGGGRLPADGSVRAPTRTHGRVGGVSGRPHTCLSTEFGQLLNPRTPGGSCAPPAHSRLAGRFCYPEHRRDSMSNGNGWRNLWAGLMVALMVVLVGATIQLHVTVADFRVQIERRFGAQDASIERRFGEVNERLARIEALIERLDPDYGQPAD